MDLLAAKPHRVHLVFLDGPQECGLGMLEVPGLSWAQSLDEAMARVEEAVQASKRFRHLGRPRTLEIRQCSKEFPSHWPIPVGLCRLLLDDDLEADTDMQPFLCATFSLEAVAGFVQ